LGTCVILRFGVSRQCAQYLDQKDAFGALNSDNSRLIRLFFQPVLIAWALWSAGAFKAWRNNKTKTNMNDAQLKLSSQICFHSASRLITKAYKPYLDEMGLRIRNI
jgi:hypothetical protein